MFIIQPIYLLDYLYSQYALFQLIRKINAGFKALENKSLPTMPLSLHCAGHLLLGMNPEDYVGKKKTLNFYLRMVIDWRELLNGECGLVSTSPLSSGSPKGPDLYRPMQAAATSVSSYALLSCAFHWFCFLGVQQPLCFLIILQSLLQGSLSPEGGGI